jgi:hypothetical protein
VLDQCSEVSLITESMCKKLNLRTYSSNASITGVNVSENIAPKGCNVVVKSRVGNFTTGVDCFVLPKITQATPAVSFDKSTIELKSESRNNACASLHIRDVTILLRLSALVNATRMTTGVRLNMSK